MNSPFTFLRRLVRPPVRMAIAPSALEAKEIAEPTQRFGRISIHLRPADPQKGERSFNRDVTKEQWNEILRVLGARRLAGDD